MRRALAVGIDEYDGASLTGCVADAEAIAATLSTNGDGSRNFDFVTLTAPQGCGLGTITRPILRARLDDLFSSKADVVLFHFSGHGIITKLGGRLVTQDTTAYDEGVPMIEVLQLANNSPAEEIIIFLDCCYSGDLGNLLGIGSNTALLREGVSVLTASRGNEPSLEADGGGVFTSLVTDALNGGAADLLGNVSVAAVYTYVDAALGAWDQRPLFKAHVSRFLPLRCCVPPIDPTILRRLPLLFPLPAEELRLDPSFEPTSTAPDATNVDIFHSLQLLSRVHLVTPVGSAHMYDAAIQSGACKLTPTGRYYWRLARDGRF